MKPTMLITPLLRSAVALSLAAVLSISQPALASGTFTVQELLPLPGKTQSNAIAISNIWNMVVGTSGVSSNSYAPCFSLLGGVWSTLTTPFGYSDATPTAVNNLNVAGYAWVHGTTWALTWPGGGAPVFLPAISGASSSFATGINSHSQVVGDAYFPNLPAHNAFVWDKTNRYWFLGWGLLGGVGCWANAINDNGWIAGTAATFSNDSHAFLWVNKNTVYDIGTFGGNRSQANAINNSGFVVGTATTANGYWHAFRFFYFMGNKTMLDLGKLPGLSQSIAQGINSAGQIVGWSGNIVGLTQSSDRAFLFDGTLKNLNTLISDPTWTLQAATGINDAGLIIGYGLHNGKPAAFLLTPK